MSRETSQHRVVYDNRGDHAGSDASVGVVIARSLKPVMSMETRRAENPRPAVLRRCFAPEHDYTAVRCKCRPLDIVAFRQDPLTGAIGMHHADGKCTAVEAGERD